MSVRWMAPGGLGAGSTRACEHECERLVVVGDGAGAAVEALNNILRGGERRPARQRGEGDDGSTRSAAPPRPWPRGSR